MEQRNCLQKKMEKMSAFRIIAVIICISIMTSCATGSSIVTGVKRPAINSTEVKIYLEEPSKYETIGIVEAAGDVSLSRQSTQDKVINKLKSQAAKIGANGVILIATGSQATSKNDQINAQGKAIYVIEE